MKRIKFCKYLQENGKCEGGRPTILGDLDDEGNEIIYRVPHNCYFNINQLRLAEHNKSKGWYRFFIPGCLKFKPVSNLEKIIQVLGELSFSTKEYFVIELEEEYLIVKKPPKELALERYRR